MDKDLDIQDQLKMLQDQFALVDMFNSGNNQCSFLIKELKDIKLKMYQELGHRNPHIHIDYGKDDNHVASYSILTGQRIEGRLSSKYDKIVAVWINDNQTILLQLWESVIAQQNDYNKYICQLSGK